MAVAMHSAATMLGARTQQRSPLVKSSPARRIVAKASPRPVVCSAEKETPVQRVVKLAAAVAASALIATSATALTKDEVNSLTYKQIKGTGIANTCATIEGGADPAVVKLPAGKYKITKLCLEPTSFTVKDESQFKGGATEFVGTKLMTRLTYTLDEIDGDATIGGAGEFTFKENDGIDYAATTVQLPGGERVPFLFTIKELNAKGTLSTFGGDFTVPSYRGATFLDPKGRGGAIGYDNAVALPSKADDESLLKENIKDTAELTGKATFQTAVINTQTGEIGGVFESIQPSDTDLGAKTPKDVKIKGLWYAQYEKL